MTNLDQLLRELDLESGRTAPPRDQTPDWSKLPPDLAAGDRVMITSANGAKQCGYVTVPPGSSGPIEHRAFIHVTAPTEQWHSLWALATDPAVVSIRRVPRLTKRWRREAALTLRLVAVVAGGLATDLEGQSP